MVGGGGRGRPQEDSALGEVDEHREEEERDSQQAMNRGCKGGGKFGVLGLKMSLYEVRGADTILPYHTPRFGVCVGICVRHALELP